MTGPEMNLLFCILVGLGIYSALYLWLNRTKRFPEQETKGKVVGKDMVLAQSPFYQGYRDFNPFAGEFTEQHSQETVIRIKMMKPRHILTFVNSRYWERLELNQEITVVYQPIVYVRTKKLKRLKILKIY